MLKSPLLILLPFLPLSADSPRVAHEAGREIVRTYEVTSIRSLDSAVINVQGQDQDVGSGKERSETLSLVVADKILAATDGAPTGFHREFTSASTDQAMEEVEGALVRDSSGASELEGLGVIFTLDAEGGAWTREYDEDSSGEDAWLEELAPGMDLSSILPEGEVAVGDSWDVPVSILGDLLRPGGTVDVKTEPGVDVPEGGVSITVPGTPDDGGWDSFEGEVVARYDSIEEEDGRRAKIVLTLELSSDLDRVEELEAEAAERGAEEDFSEALLTRSLSGEVVVLWDLIDHHALSVEGTLTGESTFSAAWAIDAGQMQLELEYEEEGSLEYEVSMEVEATGGGAD
ncbi:hypothetical protein N9109_00570 [bacterium]|nr:hypothetical protein [bacterium]